MEPALRHGDHLIYARLRPRPGDIVVARDTRDPLREDLVVKRVARIAGQHLALSSDAPGHASLRVSQQAVLGRVVLRCRRRIRASRD